MSDRTDWRFAWSRALLLAATVVLGGCSAGMVHIVPPPPGGQKVTVIVTVQQSATGQPLTVDGVVIVGGQRATLTAGTASVTVPNVPLGTASPPTQPLAVTAPGFVTSFQQLQLNTSGATAVTVPLDVADPSLTGTVGGTVTDSVAGSGVANATVQFRLNVTGSDLIIEGATDTTGAYIVGGIPAGNVIATASAQGYLSQATPVVVIQDAGSGGNPALNFQLVPTTTKVTVTGRVIDLIARTPVAGATVTIASLTPVTTRADGSFEVADVPVGDETIAVDAQGYDHYSAVVAVTPGLPALQIELAPTQSGPPPGPTTISGNVVVTNHPDNSGVTVQGILEATNKAIDTTVTPASGDYGLWVPPGTYTIRVSIGTASLEKEHVVLPGGGAVLTHVNFQITAPAVTRNPRRRR